MNIIEVYQMFPTHDDCLTHLEKVRWHGVPKCPYCHSIKCTPVKNARRYHCNTCNTSFSVTVRTIFHDTKLDLQKWFLAISLVLNAKKGISARQLARDIKVNKDTAWYMGMRIRKAMLEQSDLLKGIVEMDETYIGGKPRKGDCKDEDDKPKRGRGTHKTPVVGMIERGGKVSAKVAKNRKLNMHSLSALVREYVDTKHSILITDEYSGYNGMSKIIPHARINHQVSYANGVIHTNSIEGFWALLKRGIVGQYHKVSVKHLEKYIHEFCFRFNNRKNKAVFELAIERALGV